MIIIYPILSEQVQKLKDEIDIIIFNRIKQQIEVTETGKKSIFSANIILCERNLPESIAADVVKPFFGSLNLE
jgi:hypothetical protein